MPWSRAKALAAEVRGDPAKLEERLALFRACFRIQREACEAAGRRIPLIVENVKGAQPWVGRAHWSFGSYFLWGDIPALMPIQRYHQRLKGSAGEQWNINRPNFTGTLGWDEGLKNPGFRFDGSGKSFQTESVARHIDGRKNEGGSWFNIGSPGQKVTGKNPVHAVKNRDPDGYDRDHPAAFGWKAPRTTSKGMARKAASARIAKIPLVPEPTHRARVSPAVGGRMKPLHSSHLIRDGEACQGLRRQSVQSLCEQDCRPLAQSVTGFAEPAFQVPVVSNVVRFPAASDGQNDDGREGALLSLCLRNHRSLRSRHRDHQWQ
jgi:hypothetical protein